MLSTVRIISLMTMLAMTGIVRADSVTIDLPATAALVCADIFRPGGEPGISARISFTDAQLSPGYALRISVKAASPIFLAPGGGPPIPCGAVSWRACNLQEGIGTSGPLSTEYQTVYLSRPNTPAGAFDLVWTMSPLCHLPGLRAGTHTLILHWCVEAVQVG